MTALIGAYVRVSTGQQDTTPQIDQVKAAGATRIWSDKMSGVRSDRPGLAECVSHLREGDTLIVVALDRLGRSVIQVLNTLNDLHARGIVVKSLREGLDFSTPAGRLAATVFAAMAELERELIKERTAAARESAKARGRQVGRPPVLSKEQTDLARKLRANGEPIAVIARTIGTSRATIYRWTEEQAA